MCTWFEPLSWPLLATIGGNRVAAAVAAAVVVEAVVTVVAKELKGRDEGFLLWYPITGRVEGGLSKE